MKPQGVGIIAMGEPCFGVFAYNLAVTIKFRDPTAQIAVFYEPRTLCCLEPQELNIFDELIELTDRHQYTYQGRINPMGFKIRAHLFSPFERTILIDADSAWFGNRPVSSFFDVELAGQEFVTVNHDIQHRLDAAMLGNLIDHAPLWQVKNAFKIPGDRIIHECYTQWFYLARNQRTEAFLNQAISLYDDCQMGLRIRGSCWRNAMVNDELPLAAATALCEMAPGIRPFHPVTDGSTTELTEEQQVVTIVGEDTTEKSVRALQIANFICDMIRDVGFRWLPKPYRPKVYPY